MSTLIGVTRLIWVHLSLRLTSSPDRGFVARDCSRQRPVGYMANGSFHDELLSVHKTQTVSLTHRITRINTGLPCSETSQTHRSQRNCHGNQNYFFLRQGRNDPRPNPTGIRVIRAIRGSLPLRSQRTYAAALSQRPVRMRARERLRGLFNSPLCRCVVVVNKPLSRGTAATSSSIPSSKFQSVLIRTVVNGY